MLSSIKKFFLSILYRVFRINKYKITRNLGSYHAAKLHLAAQIRREKALKNALKAVRTERFIAIVKREMARNLAEKTRAVLIVSKHRRSLVIQRHVRQLEVAYQAYKQEKDQVVAANRKAQAVLTLQRFGRAIIFRARFLAFLDLYELDRIVTNLQLIRKRYKLRKVRREYLIARQKQREQVTQKRFLLAPFIASSNRKFIRDPSPEVLDIIGHFFEGFRPVTTKNHGNTEYFFFSKERFWLTNKVVNKTLSDLLRASGGSIIPPILWTADRLVGEETRLNPYKNTTCGFATAPFGIYEVVFEKQASGEQVLKIAPFIGVWHGHMLLSTKKLTSLPAPPKDFKTAPKVEPVPMGTAPCCPACGEFLCLCSVLAESLAESRKALNPEATAFSFTPIASSSRVTLEEMPPPREQTPGGSQFVNDLIDFSEPSVPPQSDPPSSGGSDGKGWSLVDNATWDDVQSDIPVPKRIDMEPVCRSCNNELSAKARNGKAATGWDYNYKCPDCRNKEKMQQRSEKAKAEAKLKSNPNIDYTKKCMCWRPYGFCPKHKHQVVKRDGRCVNCPNLIDAD